MRHSGFLSRRPAGVGTPVQGSAWECAELISTESDVRESGRRIEESHCVGVSVEPHGSPQHIQQCPA